MYQRLIIVGNLGRDPEMRYTQTGVPVTTFSVAVSRRWTKENGEPGEKTTWFRVTCWRKSAEIAAQYLKKGQRVLVEGEVEAQAFTDREGAPRASLELTASNFKMLSSRDEGAGGSGGGSGGGGGGAHAVDDFPHTEDDIPF